MNKKNIIQKVWQSHVISQNEGHPAVFGIDLMLIHEVTSAQAFQVLKDKGIDLMDRGALVATVDHSIPTRVDRLNILDSSAKLQVEKLRENAKEFGVPIYDFGSGHQGIVHVIGPELGFTQPGMTIVCGDSHTSTHGAFGAMAFGVGTSEVGHVMATGALLQREPKTMKVEFSGKLPDGIYSKDVIMRLIAEIGIGGANGYIIEYCGDAIGNMSMEERLTVCNMSIECGARAGMISPDEVTFNYIKGRKFAPSSERWDEAVQYWKSIASDDGCSYDKEIKIDVSKLRPMVTWGTNPGQAINIDQSIPELKDLDENQRKDAVNALDYIQLSEGQKICGVPISWAFVGSCTNGRIEDLRIAASVLRGRKISSGVNMYIVPGSESVREQAVNEGLADIFTEAGADFRMPGCSMCLGMNDDKVPAGERCISTSNRNFVGRQGIGSLTHLASPATVAASAVSGQIVSVDKLAKGRHI